MAFLKNAIFRFFTRKVYTILLCAIQCYKYFELCLFKAGSRYIIDHVKQQFADIGISVNLNKPEYSPKEKLEKTETFTISTDKAVILKMANLGTLAFGEAFASGKLKVKRNWNNNQDEHCLEHDELAEAIKRLLDNDFHAKYWNPWNRFLIYLEISLFNQQTQEKSWDVAKCHYNTGNSFFRLILDKSMQYSCAYWRNACTLQEAQINKMRLIAEKLDLKPGMRVLDLGCGWGTLCKFLCENYGVHCVGITVSKEGVEYAQNICQGLPAEFRLIDYRDEQLEKEKFDRIVSVEMLEHVGAKNYKTFLAIVHRLLKDDGIFLLHTSGTSDPIIPRMDPWYHKYIFPNSNLPRITDITEHTMGKFVIEDWHNIGWHFYKTAQSWMINLVENRKEIENQFDEKFYRIWFYNLSMSQAAFKSRKVQVWHIVMTKRGLQYEYLAKR